MLSPDFDSLQYLHACSMSEGGYFSISGRGIMQYLKALFEIQIFLGQVCFGRNRFELIDFMPIYRTVDVVI